MALTPRRKSTTEQAPEGLGARIRALRLERGLTLKQLGARASLSHPFLSQVERGLAAPSIAALQRIARALQVPPGQLWDSGPRRRFVCATSRDEAPILPAYDTGNAGEVRVLMAADQPLHVLEATGLQTEWAERPMVNSGDIVVYVIEGEVEVDLDGTAYRLSPGAAVQFSGLIPANIRAAGSEPTRVLWVRSDPPAG